MGVGQLGKTSQALNRHNLMGKESKKKEKRNQLHGCHDHKPVIKWSRAGSCFLLFVSVSYFEFESCFIFVVFSVPDGFVASIPPPIYHGADGSVYGF